MANYVSKYTGAEIEAILDASSKLNSSQTAKYVLAAPSSSAGKPTFRILAATDIPNLAASKITSGTFAAARIPSLDASKITSGTFGVDRIPTLGVSKISGLEDSLAILTNDVYKLPSREASKSGLLLGNESMYIWGSGVEITDSSQGVIASDSCIPTGLAIKDYVSNEFVNEDHIATTTTVGLVKPKAVRTTAITATTGGTTSGKYYGVELDKNGSMFVNVPWSSSSYTLPKATTTALGGVKIGSNIGVSDGTISLSASNIENALGYTPLREDALETLSTDFYTFETNVEQNYLTKATFEGLLYADGDDYILVSQAGEAPAWTLPEEVFNYSTFGAAPTSHASTGNVYGLGTTTQYGHVKISNGDVNTVASANGLVAGMDHSHGNYALTTKLPTFSLSGTVLTITDNS